MQRQRWAVVLAGGSGARLQEMIGRHEGKTAPKQYCSLNGGPSLLRLALARACAVVPCDRVLCVVAEEHEEWWGRELEELPPENILVQPMNRGTAIGTLYSLLAIQTRDPSARILFMPADHYVTEEAILSRAVSTTFLALEQNPRRVLLLGIEPDKADSELGYILSNKQSGSLAQPVVHFVEKPSTRHAKKLIRKGALWNSFVFAAEAAGLLALFRKRLPETTANFEALSARLIQDASRLTKYYRNLSSADLSNDVFSGAEHDLGVLRVPSCGWTDLGTPERLVRCLSGANKYAIAPHPNHPEHRSRVNLANVCQSALSASLN